MQIPTNQLETQAEQLVRRQAGRWGRFQRAAQIARHYRWSQLARRAAALVRRQMAGSRPIGRGEVPPDLTFRAPDRCAQAAQIITQSSGGRGSHARGDLCSGQLVLLNRPVNLGWPIAWRSDLTQVPHLWRFQLQYHEYLLSWVADREMIDSPDDPGWQTVWQIVLSWIDDLSPDRVAVRDDAWHPYCISRRTAVWIWLLALGQPAPEIERPILQSLFRQMDYLHDHLELDLGGNHLLENLTALVLAGCCLDGPGPDAWLKRAEQYLPRELEAQVLPHGEHFELAPMYHCQVLGNLLRMACVSGEKNPAICGTSLSHARRMLEFLNIVVHPDGEIALLGDSGFGEAPATDQIRQLAGLLGLDADPRGAGVTQTGPYWIYDSAADRASDFLLFDRGPVAADALPAHGHCDLLNLVASVGGCRWIIDSGNFDYEDSSMRQYCRSSLAHNVMTVDSHNQCDVWSRFRMGFRGTIGQSENGRQGAFDWATASHDGYRRQQVKRMARVVAVNSGKRCWICADYGFGIRHPCLIGYVHLAPRIDLAREDDRPGNLPVFRLDDGTHQRQLAFFGASDVQVLEGWYCPAFGIRETSHVIAYRQSLPSSCPMGWVLGLPEMQVRLIDCQDNGFVIQCDDPGNQFEWNFE